MIDLCSFIVMLCIKVFTDSRMVVFTNTGKINDQRIASAMKLGSMININVKSVFTSRKLSQTLSVKEKKPPIVNTQCVVYSFQCDLCDANYVGFTARHLHQRIREHRYSAIGKHLETQHDNKRAKIDHLFKVLKKCRSKFDCLIFEMLFIKDIKPSLNTQSDSIRAKLFSLDTFVSFVRFCLILGIILIGHTNILLFHVVIYSRFNFYHPDLIMA